MLISCWGSKGGCGKTLASILLASHFRARILDLDPQGDLARWAERAAVPCERLHQGNAQIRLIEAAQSESVFVVDCPPGHDAVAMSGMAFSQIVIIPTRSGDADLVALARALEAVKSVRANGNPELAVGVVLNAIRETGRARGVAQALRVSTEYVYLGEIRERLVYEEIYSAGKSVGRGGPAAEEIASVMSRVTSILPVLATSTKAA